MPGRGYDPLTLQLTTDDDEVEVADTGTLTAYTIITPIQYYGQQETQPFVMGSVVLDGASNAIAATAHQHLPRRSAPRAARTEQLEGHGRAEPRRHEQPLVGRT